MLVFLLTLLLVCILFFNYTGTTEIYTYGHTLSLHDALPISLPAIQDRLHVRVSVVHVGRAAGHIGGKLRYRQIERFSNREYMRAPGPGCFKALVHREDLRRRR